MLVSVYGHLVVEGLVEVICLSLVWSPSLQTLLALLKIACSCGSGFGVCILYLKVGLVGHVCLSLV